MWFLIVAGLLVIFRNSQIIWILLSLEVWNLGILSILVPSQSAPWLLFILSCQVGESVFLIGLLLLSLRSMSTL